MDAIGVRWDEWYGRLQTFVIEYKHCRVPREYKLPDGYRLGGWVHEQRQARETLSPERKARLDVLGFVWDPLSAQWEEGFDHLKVFKQREGHCRVPARHGENGFRLGGWVNWQRTNKEQLTIVRRERLDGLAFVWDAREAAWEDGISYLERYKQREGHCRVPQEYKENGFSLGAWVSAQREAREALSPERKARLDGLGLDWDPLSAQWEEGFDHLKVFKQREGHCRVAQKHRENGFPLGVWANTQRRNKEKLTVDRRDKLDKLGFVWDPLSAQWEEGFDHLKVFKQREGHCRVPAKYKFKENGYPLGQWVGVQRVNKDRLFEGRRQRLHELGFIWDTLAAAWEDGFNYLKDYKQREGHCRVPAKHEDGNGFRLGGWVNNQRMNKEKLTVERRVRLDEIGFIWEPHEQSWEEGFGYLTVFKQREGHCRVPQRHEENGFRLGGWVNNQRTNKEKLTVERRKRLDELGFIWAV